VAKPTAHNERALLYSLAQGDETAFEELFYHHWEQVYSTASLFMKSSELANDIAQDTFLALWNNRHNAEKIMHLTAYLCTHVKFMVHKHLRRMKVEDAYAIYLKQKSHIDASSAEQEEYLGLKELQSTIHDGIERLPQQQRRAFKLSREEGLTHEQIGQLMGISKKTVKDYIVRSIAFLRPYVKHYSGLLLLLFNGQL
jgi:RNA polymerase sigma-70 factor (family 1)